MANERVSSFGHYAGYSEPTYDGYELSSQYVTMHDGIRLAIDILRPMKGGKVAENPLPVLWTHTRYTRSQVRDGVVEPTFGTWDLMLPLIPHGYVIAAVDVRGGGASFGRYEGMLSSKEQEDSYEITEWLADQPWSDGNIGMYGRSYLGITQYLCAALKPPHLKAIFPEMAWFDAYEYLYPGGIFRGDYAAGWGAQVRLMDLGFATQMESPGLVYAPVAPVESDLDGALLSAARRDHLWNRDAFTLFSTTPYRDSVDPETGERIWETISPATKLQKIEESEVAIYHWTGWYDAFTSSPFQFFVNLKNPQKIAVVPFYHSWEEGEDKIIRLATEQLRWFDYWLKGIENGIMDEPRIHYWLLNGPEEAKWRTSNEWPLPGGNPVKLYFSGGPSGSIASTNDGSLAEEVPATDEGDERRIDYTTTTGPGTRWANAAYGAYRRGRPFEEGEDYAYPDMRLNDAKGLTYTTRPLSEDIVVVGHPVVRLWVTSTADDNDFFVYLEEVLPEGFSKYVSEGALRGSHRALGEPPFDNLGLPRHLSLASVISPLPSNPVELLLSMEPTAQVFKRGSRIRVSVTCADIDNATTPIIEPPPMVTVLLGEGHASYIELPVIP